MAKAGAITFSKTGNKKPNMENGNSPETEINYVADTTPVIDYQELITDDRLRSNIQGEAGRRQYRTNEYTDTALQELSDLLGVSNLSAVHRLAIIIANKVMKGD